MVARMVAAGVRVPGRAQHITNTSNMDNIDKPPVKVGNRRIGINDFLSKKFDTYDFDGPWKESFGQPERNFRMIVYGDSGHGKTDFCIQLAKYMAKFTKVYYNSPEQGISKTLQDALNRHNMSEVTGRVIFGKDSFAEMMEYLGKRGAPQCAVIDSRDYMNLTPVQWKKMVKAHPRKSFIVVTWAQGEKPKGQAARDIEYMCDMKVYVANFKAHSRSRNGGNKPFVIWEKPTVGLVKVAQTSLEL